MRILFLVHRYPTVTETFTINEVNWWRRYGLNVDIISFRRPTTSDNATVGKEVADAASSTTYLDSRFLRGFVPSITGFGDKFFDPTYGPIKVITAPYRNFNSNRLRLRALISWLRALQIAMLVKKRPYDVLHAQFSDDAATTAMIASVFSNVPFTFRSYTSYNPQLLSEKLRYSSLVLSCSEFDRKLLIRDFVRSGPVPAKIDGVRENDQQEIRAVSEKIVVNYLGVDTIKIRSDRDSALDSRRIVCVGRLQEKKGQEYLIGACKLLKNRGVNFNCYLVGDGPTRRDLEHVIHNDGLDNRVVITGWMTRLNVRTLMAGASVVCMPSIVARNGDVDGIPFALMEAMAQGRACVSTKVSGIGELIDHGRNGFLVDEKDDRALADALQLLLENADLRLAMGREARKTIEERFDIRQHAKVSAEMMSNALSRL